jgi:U3 small nucleolar RNA-associated protein 5
MAVHLDSNKKGNASLLVVRGTFVKPVFERVPLNATAAATSAEPQVISLAPTQGGVLLADTTNAVAGAAKASSKAALANGPASAAAAKVLGPDNEGSLVQQRVAAAVAAAAAPGRRKRSEPEPDAAADAPGTAAAAAAAAAAAEVDGLAVDSDEEALAGQEATLGQRVAAMEQRQQQYQQPAKGSAAGTSSSAAAAEGDEELPDAGAAAALPVGSLKADSLVTLLQQALRSADRSLLERCLNVSNPRVINNSVRRLVPMDAAALLREAVARLQTKPSRGQQLAAWVRAVLVYHTAYLMSAPGVQPVLTSLYQVRVGRWPGTRVV